jgi:hypothetical protein
MCRQEREGEHTTTCTTRGSSPSANADPVFPELPPINSSLSTIIIRCVKHNMIVNVCEGQLNGERAEAELLASGRGREQRRHDGKQNARQLTGRRTCSVHRMMSHRLLPARYVARCVDKLSANRGGGSHQVLQLCGPFLSFVYSAACVLICLLSSRLPHPAQSPTLRHESETQTGDAPQRHG